MSRLACLETLQSTLIAPSASSVLLPQSGWNDTVAGLTLMAIGTSAPEIMIAVVEAFKGLGEPADSMGPGTIVGSATYNFFVISAICIMSLPAGKSTSISNYRTFFFTAVFSVWGESLGRPGIRNL